MTDTNLLPCRFCESIDGPMLCDNGEYTWITCDECGARGPEDMSEAKAIAAWNRPSPPTAGKVKGLAWREDEEDRHPFYRARTDIGPVYTIYDDGFSTPPFVLTLHQLVLGSFERVDDAKAAAQADYDRRILSALHPAPSVEDWPDVEEDDPEVLIAAKAIAEHGIGRPWDDFLPMNAYDFDHGDLIEYGRAAVAALLSAAPPPPQDGGEVERLRTAVINALANAAYHDERDGEIAIDIARAALRDGGERPKTWGEWERAQQEKERGE